MMKILITGATGFIGNAMVEKLSVQDSLEILATGRTSTSRFEGLEHVRYNARELSSPGPDMDCDVCIHCAGLASDSSSFEEFQVNNVWATQNLLMRIPNCRKFIFISSASVYDFSDGKPKSESDAGPSGYLSMYGASKLAAEKVVTDATIPQKFILRPRAVYGPGDRHLLPRLKRLVKGPFIIYPGKMPVMGSLTHIHNLVHAVQLCIDSSLMGTQIFNIADSAPYTIVKVLVDLFSEGQAKIPIPVPPAILRPILQLKEGLGVRSGASVQSLNYLSYNSVLDVRRAEELLNYMAKLSIHDFLAKQS